MLINSANLMGGSAEPDGYRGFGRIHLAMGMPLGGEESLALFVADSASYKLADGDAHEFAFEVDSAAGLDFRATISWIDPPTSVLARVQLANNLDLSVVTPGGTIRTMWSSSSFATGVADLVNVNERVIVDAADVEGGTYTVRVTADGLTTATQSYSLVVNGAISPLAASSEAPSAPSPVSSSSSSFSVPSAPTALSPPGSSSSSSSRTPSNSVGTPSPFVIGSGDDDGSGADASTRSTSGAAMVTRVAMPGLLFLFSLVGGAATAMMAVACASA